jgi:hypothetical protein
MDHWAVSTSNAPHKRYLFFRSSKLSGSRWNTSQGAFSFLGVQDTCRRIGVGPLQAERVMAKQDHKLAETQIAARRVRTHGPTKINNSDPALTTVCATQATTGAAPQLRVTRVAATLGARASAIHTAS